MALLLLSDAPNGYQYFLTEVLVFHTPASGSGQETHGNHIQCAECSGLQDFFCEEVTL
jgi:hypothetical protein